MSFKSQDNNPNSFEVSVNDTHFQLTQNIRPYKEYAAASREAHWDSRMSRTKTHWKPFATIPDIVAIDILTKYGLDIHSPDFGHDLVGKRKLVGIIKSEYPDLLLS